MLPPQARASVLAALVTVTEAEEEEAWGYICIALYRPKHSLSISRQRVCDCSITNNQTLLEHYSIHRYWSVRKPAGCI
jgi:hypothetical protein